MRAGPSGRRVRPNRDRGVSIGAFTRVGKALGARLRRRLARRGWSGGLLSRGTPTSFKGEGYIRSIPGLGERGISSYGDQGEGCEGGVWRGYGVGPSSDRRPAGLNQYTPPGAGWLLRSPPPARKHHDPGRLHQEMARRDPNRTRHRPEPLHRPLPPAGPARSDRCRPQGEWFCFEKGATKAGAATAGPMSGGAAALAGSTRDPARTWRRPSGSCSFTPRPWSTRRS